MKASVVFSIKTKFVLIAALIVALFSLTWGGHVIREEKAHLLHNLEDNGRFLLTSLKAPIINTMILAEMGVVPSLLDNFVEEIIKNPNVPAVYAFIVDENGKVLAHNHPGYYGMLYNDPITRAALAENGYRHGVVDDGLGDILDMALPLRIAGKSWGALRVGFSMSPMEDKYHAFRMRILMFSALLFLAGTGIFFLVGHSMSRPLARLSQAMSHVDLGAFEAHPPAPRRDEIGMLQNSFHDMLVRLQKSEQERQRALNQLIQQEKMATIGKIVAGVAHEINNPLAAISACGYKLKGIMPGGMENCVEILNEGTLRIQGIVQQLSDFSRTCSLELQHVASDTFFKEITNFARMALKRADVRFTATDNCQPTVLSIDKGKLHQVVLNLLVNAADASPPHGSIELTADIRGDDYCLTVKDQGAGIPPEHIERIFDIFYTTKPAGEGTGIGLAICKSIVELHQGTIKVDSGPAGTSFTFTIPIERDTTVDCA